MTTLLYQTDSYLRTFSAEIVEVDPANKTVILDQTAFYPGGGGQPCDRGVMEIAGLSYPVYKVKKVGDHVLHYLTGEEELPKIGMAIRGHIDWDHRYQLMRTHTALHILCGVVFRDYGALVTGGDMEPLQGRMDFEFETMHKELVDEIEVSVNEEIKLARQVRTTILPRDQAFAIPDLIRTKINLLPEGINQVRVVEIVGLDLQADGGTHVANTNEVGQVSVIDYKSKGKINKRIYIDIH